MPIFNPIVKGAGGGDCPTTAKLMQTGQTISFRTDDDGYKQAGRDINFFKVRNNPAEGVVAKFGHNWRFTGLTGGYYDQDTSEWKDKDGNVTTDALAFPDDIVIDWSTFEKETGDVLMWYRIPKLNITWDAAFIYTGGLTIGGFSWRVANIAEYFTIYNWGLSLSKWSYQPFGIAYTGFFWTSSSIDAIEGVVAYPFSTLQPISKAAKTSSSGRGVIAVRTGNISEL